MTSEWILTLLTDPQGFLKLLQQYFTVPFTGDSTDTAVFSMFWESVLNHPLWLLGIVLFALLLGGSLLVGAIAAASDTHREKREQMERHLAKHERRQEENWALDFIAPYEREELD